MAIKNTTMFNFFKSKQPLQNLKTVTLKLSGLHCTSCAVNIDLALEDLPSVSSKTNYQKSETTINYDPKITSLNRIKSVISSLEYKIIN